MPRSTATITAEQRRAIYELVCGHLVGLSDLCLALIHKDFATAHRLGLEFGEDLRLMEDLGWEEEDGRQVVALTMPAEDLTETLKRLCAEAAGGLAESPEERGAVEEEEEAKARYRLAIAVCSELMDRLDPREGDSA